MKWKSFNFLKNYDLYSNIYNENINQFNYERKRNDDELNVVKNIYLSIENMDNKQIDKENFITLHETRL